MPRGPMWLVVSSNWTVLSIHEQITQYLGRLPTYRVENPKLRFCCVTCFAWSEQPRVSWPNWTEQRYGASAHTFWYPFSKISGGFPKYCLSMISHLCAVINFQSDTSTAQMSFGATGNRSDWKEFQVNAGKDW